MTSMDYDGHKINWNQESTDQILAKIGIVGGTAINIPMLVINGFGTTKTWGSALSTYNLNHDAFFNGISGTQSAWNRMMFDMNRSFSIAELDRGGLRMMGGDMFGLSDLAGIGLERISEDYPYAGILLGALAIVATKGKATDDVLKMDLAIQKAEMKVLSKAEMANIWGAGPLRIDPQNLPKSVTSDFTEILAGRGNARMTGNVQTILQNRGGVNLKWVGAKEWKITDVSGTTLNGSRILQHPNGKWGLVINHDYKNIIQIPTSSTVKWK